MIELKYILFFFLEINVNWESIKIAVFLLLDIRYVMTKDIASSHAWPCTRAMLLITVKTVHCLWQCEQRPCCWEDRPVYVIGHKVKMHLNCLKISYWLLFCFSIGYMAKKWRNAKHDIIRIIFGTHSFGVRVKLVGRRMCINILICSVNIWTSWRLTRSMVKMTKEVSTNIVDFAFMDHHQKADLYLGGIQYRPDQT